MNSKKIIFVAIFFLIGLQITFAQNPPSPKLSETLAKNLEQAQQTTEVSRERREQAYAKLLEGQRYIWNMSRLSSQAGIVNGERLAKQSLRKAVELDPTLAEGYTALAELTLTAPPNDLEEAIMLANIAVKIDPNNFGGHRILARLYTIKSHLNNGGLDITFAAKAISEWQEIARLDARNAEAFAFLSEFYDKTNKPAERIDALKKWLASAAPLEIRFYRTIMGAQEELIPEAASLKLGEALIEKGETKEAVEILSRAVADDPNNLRAIELLREAIEAADGNLAATAVQALQQAVFANPDNISLIILLAQVQARTGKIDDAAKVLRDATAKLADKDKNSGANLQVALGDIYLGVNRFDEAIAVYQNALTVRGIRQDESVLDNDRDFAIRVYDKMISTYKKANRPNDAKALIERARLLFGNKDLFADKQLISFYRETGKKTEALQAIRALRASRTDDYGLLRLEASILTDNGKVDEAITLVKTLINKKAAGKSSDKIDGAETVMINLPMYDDFTNYLFISNLYSQAKRGKEAVEAANQAHLVANGDDRKQIAKLTLATAQQMAGEYLSAEETLRGLLKQSPRNPIALNNLGYFLAERSEKLNEALEFINQALKIDPTNPSYLDSLGWAYFKLGKFDEAEKYLKDALRFDSTSATINEHLGDVYHQQGKLELAKSAWQKALNLISDTEEMSRLNTKLTLKNLK
ncbi:MAG: tetratricopeptide repeat protein [Acidobacteriota bacterium]|nr:tetratricopeptide repeat protein [Acidobacteriota bacterium]